MEKRKKPDFFRREWHRYLRLGRKSKKKRVWRDSKGRHSKVRLKIKGKPLRPSVGFQENKEIRGFIDGIKPVFIETLEQLSKVEKNEGVIISGKLGKRKRMQILEEANKKGLKILNKYKKEGEKNEN